MSHAAKPPLGLHRVESSPVPGLAVAERRVVNPEATLVCVHGGLDRGGSFARMARRSERFDVVAYDRRGYQGSRSLTPAGLGSHIEDLLALVAVEARRGPVIAFGHSFGGLVALAAAISEPTLLDLVVVYETPLPWVVARDGAHASLSDDYEGEAERFFRRMVSSNAWDRLSAKEQASRRADGFALVDDLRLVRGGARPFDVEDVKVPVLYAYGDGPRRDYYARLSAALHERNALIDTACIGHAGHGAHLSAPDHLAGLVAAAWDRVCASA